ncbi:MAG: OmpA family protein [bacterium]|nr:OmpA family protein [bacterium]
MSRRDDHPARQSAPFWMSSYADLVTQILIFFVLLYSMSVIDIQRFSAALASVQHTLGIPPGTVEPPPLLFDPADGTELADLDELIFQRDLAQLLGVYRRLELEVGDAAQAELLLEERGIVVRFPERILFDTGSADLRPEALAALDHLLPILADIPNAIRVEGHTDSRPISTIQFPSNWELSTARATAVIRYLIEFRGMDPLRLSAAGYAEFRPLAPDTTPEAMARNRRVDLVILRVSLGAGEPRAQTE